MPLGKIDKSLIRKELAALSEKASQRKASRGQVEFYTLPKGKTIMRVMPPWSETAGTPIRDTWTHFKLPPDNKTILSLSTWGITPDPIMEAISHIRHHTGKDMGRYISTYKGNVIAYVRKVETVTRTIPGQDEESVEHLDGLRIVKIPQSVKLFLLTTLLGEETEEDEYADITDPFTGIDIEVNKKGEGLETSYISTITASRKYNGPIIKKPGGEADDEAIEKVISQMPDLDKIFARPTEEGLEEYQEIAEKMVAHFGCPPMGTATTTSSAAPKTAEPPKKQGRQGGRPSCYGRYAEVQHTQEDKCALCAFDIACRQIKLNDDED